MPKLKLTYTQIKEQAARDIRNRTAARQAQLKRLTVVQDFEETDSEVEDTEFEETDSEVRDTGRKGFCYKAQLFFLFLVLVFLLLYHAGKQTKKV
jgi:hypothetical protein